VGYLFESSGNVEQSEHIAVPALSVQLLAVVPNLGEDSQYQIHILPPT